jgi:hypothetical protein
LQGEGWADMTDRNICEIELSAATSLAHVVAAASRFAATLRPARAGAIPADYRPRRITTREDIVHWATRLALYHACGGDADSPELERARIFFHHAAAHADQLGPRRASSAGFHE